MKTKKLKKIAIYVTKNDMLCGQKGSSRHCPIALAMRRKGIAALIGHINWRTTPFSKARMLPKKACEFIKIFDSGGTVLPIRFTVEV